MLAARSAQQMMRFIDDQISVLSIADRLLQLESQLGFGLTLPYDIPVLTKQRVLERLQRTHREVFHRKPTSVSCCRLHDNDRTFIISRGLLDQTFGYDLHQP